MRDFLATYSRLSPSLFPPFATLYIIRNKIEKRVTNPCSCYRARARINHGDRASRNDRRNDLRSSSARETIARVAFLPRFVVSYAAANSRDNYNYGRPADRIHHASQSVRD